ncbi:MAG: zinc-binding dehydrogenase [Christensenellales bacterium]
MKTKAVRMYGKCDLRLEEFELPALKDDEILVRLESDSLCMSSYKAAKQGSEHARVPDGIDKNPVIIGHEFCGQIVEVGKKWADKYKAGEKCSVQPALNYKGSLASPGYSYQYVGGDATYVILPNEVMECNCLLEYSGESYFAGSLAEPVSCIIGGFHCCYHATNGIWEHRMDIVKDGKMAILAGVGPMGLGAIDYALNRERKPKLLVVTDIDDTRLQRAESIFSCEYAKERGVELHYVNTAKVDNAVETLLGFTDGEGYNDVFVMAPVKPVVEQGDAILAMDGCMNFFAGPTDKSFSANFNFYNVHYKFTHIVGNSGGNTDDMREALNMMSKGLINPAVMITHVGGLNCVPETTLNLPNIKGGKKLIYNHIDFPLTAIEDFAKLGEKDELMKALGEICARHNQLWNDEAEKYLLAHAKRI